MPSHPHTEAPIEELIKQGRLGTIDGKDDVLLDELNDFNKTHEYVAVCPHIYHSIEEYYRLKEGIQQGRTYGCQGIFCDECTWPC